MASKIIILPMTNTVLGSDYTGTIEVGDPPVSVALILDSGSSALGIAAHHYKPVIGKGAESTDLVQSMSYGSGAWFGSVVKTTVSIGAGASQISVPNCSVGVAKTNTSDMFKPAGGILGLAYIGLDDAFQMPGATWPLKYDFNQVKKLGKAANVDPFFNQLVGAEGIDQKFGFYSLRSIVRSAAGVDSATDPFNQGWIILGGGPESTNLFTGAFQTANVVGDDWYDTNIKSVQVGDQPPIPVQSFLETTSNGWKVSNSIIDTGTNSIMIYQPIYDKMLSSFEALNADFASAIKTASLGAGQAVGNDVLTNLNWPPVQFVLEGVGADVTLTLSPDTYWQTDAGQANAAIFMILGSSSNQSILGLPLLNNYFTVFDQTGNGTIEFAQIVGPTGGALPQP